MCVYWVFLVGVRDDRRGFARFLDEDFFVGVCLVVDFLDEDFFVGVVFLVGDGLVGVVFLEDVFFVGVVFLAARVVGAVSSVFGVGLRLRFGCLFVVFLFVNKDVMISNICMMILSVRILMVMFVMSVSGEFIFVSVFFAAILAACFMFGLNCARRTRCDV